jgi:response regulator RpfG family c-di-GMP phosphodiesterase
MQSPLDDSSKSILVIDDDLAVCELLADSLAMFGHPAYTASNASEALEIVKRESIQLVLTDIDMPEVDGFEVLRSIKSYDADVEVVMVTGATDVDIAVRAIREGASDYVTKPLNLDEVQIVVERTLKKRQLVLGDRAHRERLEELVDVRTREVTRLCSDLTDSYESTLHALMTALDFRDNETQGHSYRVVEYAVLVAEQMGIKEPALTRIRRGAILHDVGKIGVADAVLRKPGKLNAEEWKEMRRHPELGYRMLKDISFLRACLDIVLSHQERYDGSGYPQGLKGEQISLGARIFAVVDTFDAMTSDRPYRPACSITVARDEIRRCSNSQFDPRVAEAFLSIEEPTWHKIRERVHRKVRALEEQVKRAVGQDPS